jgi:hypothetical protein
MGGDFSRMFRAAKHGHCTLYYEYEDIVHLKERKEKEENSWNGYN